MLTIEAYDPAWPRMYVAEANRLRDAFGVDALRIEHVGSTSVPGLSAKAVIDIQVSVRTLDPVGRYTALMESLGYLHVPQGDFTLVYPFYCRPAVWPSTHHVHLCVAGGEPEAQHLAFRDGLRREPALAAEYVVLKRRLAALHHGDTLESREAYSIAKSDFVEMVLARARLP